MDNRMRLYQHIVLSGGCTMIPGLPARLEKDIRAMYLAKVLQVCLYAPYRRYKCPQRHREVRRNFGMQLKSASPYVSKRLLTR